MSETAGATREREQAAVMALNEQEDYVRRLGHLSDEELTKQLIATLRQEKSRLDRWIDSGECLVLSSAGKVHLPQCPSMRQFVDRDAAWKPYLDDLDNAPDMPTLLTRAEVEGLKVYKTCSVCAPTLDHADNRPGLRGWKVLKCGSLKTKHFGKVFNFVGGEKVGFLTRISTAETMEGLEFRAEFDGLDDPVTDPSVEVMYRTPCLSTWPPLVEGN